MTPGQVDERYMRIALRWARRGAGRTSPNPMVGAILVRGGEVIAAGYHRRAGEDHAEIVALKRAGARARGATLYLNLEPCDHVGRTPPCTPSLINSGVRKVVVGMIDPNPQVSGRGIRRLRQAGIKVEVGVLEAECRTINLSFIKYITKKIPFVTLKLAASLDGKIATCTGNSQWITGKKAREFVHRLRNEVDAVLVGVETVIADNPRLTCRVRGGRDPWRVILDGHLRMPLTARLLQQPARGKTIVVTGATASAKGISALKRRGAQVWALPLRDGDVPWKPLLTRLAQIGVMSVMIEGGAVTATKALAGKVVDRICFFYAPKIIGGDGKSMIGSLGITKVASALKVRGAEITKLGKDFLLSAYLQSS
ncbi:MAG: bifunctional diaminohydroxyphosphoribosylaminopyrimidine deaminase/5-amino-6-(5-phosphoribosylamino)uracil reductase RibD [Candidatus Binatia bacterium]